MIIKRTRHSYLNARTGRHFPDNHDLIMIEGVYRIGSGRLQGLVADRKARDQQYCRPGDGWST